MQPAWSDEVKEQEPLVKSIPVFLARTGVSCMTLAL